MTFEYTGGREGTHSITMSKPIGGGVVDIEHVPLDLIDHYSENGYYALDSTGLYPHVGYCINQPATQENPDGVDCYPATITPVLFATSTPAPTPSAAPTELPHVGGSNLGILFPLIVAIVGSAMISRRKRAR